MVEKGKSFRAVKKNIGELLKDNQFDIDRFDADWVEKQDVSRIQIINALFPFFYSGDSLLKERAVELMGVVVSQVADLDMESARIVMRRLMWNLNDESGGIGWGSPEAMGAIMARNKRLALEYWKILISYLRIDGNFLEHEGLQRGVLWAVGRVAHARPELVGDISGELEFFKASKDDRLRELAHWAGERLTPPCS